MEPAVSNQMLVTTTYIDHGTFCFKKNVEPNYNQICGELTNSSICSN